MVGTPQGVTALPPVPRPTGGPSETARAPRRRAEPPPGKRVRHVLTGDVGVLHRIDYPDTWAGWARVAWDDDDGPGMTRDGLAFIPPRLLVAQ